jgi:deoxyribose-phosphate aldolase
MRPLQYNLHVIKSITSNIFIQNEKDIRSFKMQLSYKDIPKFIDISAVRTDVTYEEIEEMARIAKKFHFICAFTMPCFTHRLAELLRGSDVLLGGTAGFPSGAGSTEEKVFCAIREKAMGCDEIDMVINVGALLSGDYEFVGKDIKAVVDAVNPLPVKTILEIAYLNDEQIGKACELAVNSGVAYVKSGTGWASKPTTVQTIQVMREAVGERIRIKAAGGIRSLAVMEEMVEAGCNRFGISLNSALKILKEAYDREGIIFDEEI